MNNQNSTMTEAASEAKGPSLNEKKAWFRRARPNGGMVLNPLRVTDQMAIFEARLFADTGDHNPLASFTATRSADKAKQYIRAAQEDALNEALDNAGFGVPPCSEASQVDDSSKTEKDAPPEKAKVEKPLETPPKQTTEPKKAVSDTTPPAPKVQERPAPVAPHPRKVAEPAATEKTDAAPAVLDIATGKPRENQSTPASQTAPVAPADETQESAPGAYTADMTVEEICRVMTLEQAKGIVVRDGTCKGWTLEQVAKDRPTSLKWFQFACPFADNVLKAASKLVLADLELKMAG